MIVLDTNVVSEVMKPKPDPAVISWLDAQETTDVFVCAVTVAEISFGLEILPEGRRRDDLRRRFEGFVTGGFADRVLPLDQAAARLYGTIMAHRKTLGRPMALCDGQIAASARLHGMTLATRNVRDFVHCGLEVVDPFGG